MDLKEKISYYKSIFLNLPSGETEKKAIKKIAELVLQLSDDDEDTIDLLRFATSIYHEKDTLSENLVKKFFSIVDTAKEEEKLSCYKALISHGSVDAASKEVIAEKMLALLDD